MPQFTSLLNKEIWIFLEIFVSILEMKFKKAYLKKIKKSLLIVYYIKCSIVS